MALAGAVGSAKRSPAQLLRGAPPGIKLPDRFAKLAPPERGVPFMGALLWPLAGLVLFSTAAPLQNGKAGAPLPAGIRLLRTMTTPKATPVRQVAFANQGRELIAL